MDLVIIILNWNNPEITINAVNSLLWGKEIKVKIVVADNGSTDNSVKDFMGMPFVDILQLHKNYGYAKGYNVAVSYVLNKYKPKYVLLLNNDTLARKDTIDKLYENKDKADILCPKIFNSDGKTIWACGGDVSLWRAFAKNRGQGELDIGQYQAITDTHFASGCAMWINTNVVKAIGLFNPEYKYYYEDVDFCVRAKKEGYSIKYIPSTAINHLVGQTAGSEYENTQSYFRWRNRIIFVKANLSTMSRFIFIVILLPFIVLRDSFRYLKMGLIKELFTAYRGIWSTVRVCPIKNDKK